VNASASNEGYILGIKEMELEPCHICQGDQMYSEKDPQLFQATAPNLELIYLHHEEVNISTAAMQRM
jgi:hypothetical protein